MQCLCSKLLYYFCYFPLLWDPTKTAITVWLVVIPSRVHPTEGMAHSWGGPAVFLQVLHLVRSSSSSKKQHNYALGKKKRAVFVLHVKYSEVNKKLAWAPWTKDCVISVCSYKYSVWTKSVKAKLFDYPTLVINSIKNNTCFSATMIKIAYKQYIDSVMKQQY